MRARATAVIVVVAMLSAAAGCGGSSSKSNGVAAKSANAIVQQALAAARSADSVHVSGTLPSGGRTLTIDIHVDGSRGGKGRMSENGLGVDIVRIGGKAYMRGTAAFWRSFGGEAAAQLFAGRWIVGSASSGNLASLTPLTDLQQIVDAMFADHGKLAKAGTMTVDGQPVVAVEDSARGGTLYVATMGQPYPVELVRTGSSPGKLKFDQWNAKVTLTAPKGAIDYSQLVS